jgi:DNA-binding response OmpR family regulator
MDRALSGACEADLRGRGFRVVTAEDADQALRAARSEPPDLVLLDMLGRRVSQIVSRT